MVIRYDNNNRGLTVPFHFTVISDESSSISFRLEDEFTYWASGNPLVEGAKVILTAAYDTTNSRRQNLLDIYTQQSNSNGVAIFNDINTGVYNIRIISDDHESFSARINVNPGDNDPITVFLFRNVVTITWSVVPTVVEETIEVKVSTDFKTNVPIPVVAVDPLKVNVFDMICPGATQIDFNITNHGLVKADNFRFNFPQFDELIIHDTFDFYDDIPAKTSVIVPIIFEWVSCPSLSISSRRRLNSINGVCSISAKFTWELLCGDLKMYSGSIELSGYVSCGYINCNGHKGGGGGDGSAPSFTGSSTGSYSPITCNPCLFAVGKAIYECYEIASWFVPVARGIRTGVKLARIAAKGVRGAKAAGKKLLKIADNAAEAYAEQTLENLESLTPSDLLKDGPGAIIDAFDPINPVLDRIKNCYEALNQLYEQCFNKSKANIRRLQTEDELILNTFEAFERLESILIFFEYIYGNGSFMYNNITNDETKLVLFKTKLLDMISPNSEDGKYITNNELQLLINNDTIKFGDITDAEIEWFVERYDASIKLLELGIFNENDNNIFDNGNYFLYDNLVELQSKANESLYYEIELGYTYLGESLLEESALLIQEIENPKEGVCATVRIQLSQTAVLTRQAFEATLEINNEMDTDISNITVIIEWFSELTRDYVDAFFVSDPELSDSWLYDTSGNGVIPSASTGVAKWILIPKSEAVRGSNIVTYFIGGVLTYVENGLLVTVDLFPQPIDVAPDPTLKIFYFWEKIVYSDDPFTDEVEPAIPFSLVIAVKNDGNGTALNFKIESSQPEIIDNEKGLLVNFEIIGTQLGKESLKPTLTIDFGEIAPKSVEIGRWLMISSLQGIFSNFNATFVHKSLFNDSDLSLIESVDIYDLNHIVTLDTMDLDDGLDDMLVNENTAPRVVYNSQNMKRIKVKRLNLDIISNNSCVNMTLIDNLPLDLIVVINLCDEIFVNNSVNVGDWYYMSITQPNIIVDESLRLIYTSEKMSNRNILNTNSWSTYRLIRRVVKDEVISLIHTFDNYRNKTSLSYEYHFKPLQSVSDLNIAFITSNSIKLEWITNNIIGSGSVNYNVKWNNNNNKQTIENNIIIDSLSPNTKYTFSVSPYMNSNSSSKIVSIIEATTLPCQLSNNDCDSKSVNISSCQCIIFDPTNPPSITPTLNTISPTNKPTKQITDNPSNIPTSTPTITIGTAPCCIWKSRFSDFSYECIGLDIQECRGNNKCRWCKADGSCGKTELCGVTGNPPTKSPEKEDACCLDKRQNIEKKCSGLDISSCRGDNTCRWCKANSCRRFDECNKV